MIKQVNLSDYNYRGKQQHREYKYSVTYGLKLSIDLEQLLVSKHGRRFIFQTAIRHHRFEKTNKQTNKLLN